MMTGDIENGKLQQQQGGEVVFAVETKTYDGHDSGGGAKTESTADMSSSCYNNCAGGDRDLLCTKKSKLDESFQHMHDQLSQQKHQGTKTTAGAGAGAADVKSSHHPNHHQGQSQSQTTDNTSFFKASSSKHKNHNIWFFVLLILVVGVGISSTFIVFGITQVENSTNQRFTNQAVSLIQSISQAFTDFETATLWIHNSCRSTSDQYDQYIGRGICSRKNFDGLYEYLISTGLEFQAITWLPNITHTERLLLEDESYEYYSTNYPSINYTGFKGLEPDSNSPMGLSMQQRSNQSYYFPAHYVLPLEGFNIAALDFDLLSSPSRKAAIEVAMSTYRPALTMRLKLLDGDASDAGYSVILFHPGIPLSKSSSSQEEQPQPAPQPQELALMVVNLNDLIERSVRSQAESVRIVLYDMTDVTTSEEEGTEHQPLFLGGADVVVVDSTTTSSPSSKREIETVFLDDIEYATLLQERQNTGTGTGTGTTGSGLWEEQDLDIGDRRWKAVVVPYKDTYKSDTLFVVIGGMVMLLACITLAFWLYFSMKRARKLQDLQRATEAEKAKLVVETAHETAVAERELNDFIAHEVRNPLAAAMSATSFVSTAVNDSKPLPTEESQKSVREDVDVIKSSLQYINDLLRNMLDWHRIGSAQMNIELAPTDLLRDVLEPSATMLYSRGNDFEVIVDCQENLVVMTDRMRLKQIVLNFALNSRKFVDKGYIKLRACVDSDSSTNGQHDNVKIYIEDSGPGIPLDKRKNLFAKFQESLDSLNQGTGIGLSLCRKLSRLMNGDVYLDEGFHSGIEGCPGTRFVVDLNSIPMNLEEDDTLNQLEAMNKGGGSTDSLLTPAEEEQQQGCCDSSNDNAVRDLPEQCKVLFVDDDLVLRKLFTRSLKRVAPDWQVQEASNGETAIRLCESPGDEFDLIFMDMYMASVEKQLLGTETVRVLRGQGCESRICGLSANDAEDAFLRSGADSFMFKPFPCEQEALKRELLRILYGSGQQGAH